MIKDNLFPRQTARPSTPTLKAILVELQGRSFPSSAPRAWARDGLAAACTRDAAGRTAPKTRTRLSLDP